MNPTWTDVAALYRARLAWCARIVELYPLLDALDCPKPQEVGAAHLRWYSGPSSENPVMAPRGSATIWTLRNDDLDQNGFRAFAFTIYKSGSRIFDEHVSDPTRLKTTVENFVAALKTHVYWQPSKKRSDRRSRPTR